MASVLEAGSSRYFYPRSPCGERRYIAIRPTFYDTISIHALLAESDSRTKSVFTEVGDFYPRSPCGERRQSWRKPHGQKRFLSTLSLRRATLRRSANCNCHSISIHALLAESDLTIMLYDTSSLIFLSTLSLRRATALGLPGWLRTLISIHALLAESDSKSAQNSGALLRIWNKFYGDCIFMLTGKAVFYPFCPCFFHIFWCEGTGNFMIAFPSH